MIYYGTIRLRLCSSPFLYFNLSFLFSPILRLLPLVVVKWQLLFQKRPPRERECRGRENTEQQQSQSILSYNIIQILTQHNERNEIETVSPYYFFPFHLSLLSSMLYLINSFLMFEFHQFVAFVRRTSFFVIVFPHVLFE